MVGVGYTTREYCDGQSLASLGGWPVQQRRYPENTPWKVVSDIFMSYAERQGTAELLMRLAVGRVEHCPFDAQSVRELKDSTVEALKRHGSELRRELADRRDLPIDFRYLDLLLRAAGDPEVHLGSFAKGVRVGPGARLPKIARAVQSQEKVATPRANGPPGQPRRDIKHGAKLLTEQVLAVVEDQAERGSRF